MPSTSRSPRVTGRHLPLLAYQHDPIRQGVSRLGRKWTLLIVRDLAFLKLTRFGEFRRNNPGLSARVLSRRLREMEREGLVVREVAEKSIRYHLTARGEDAALIVLAFLNYGLKHHVGPRPPLAPTPQGRPPTRGTHDDSRRRA